MIKKFFFYFTVLFPIFLGAQENQFKNYVDTLTSLSFFGRGYVNDGHLHAAKYIKKEFENVNLYFIPIKIIINNIESFNKQIVDYVENAILFENNRLHARLLDC